MVMNEQDLKQVINESVLDKIHFEFVQALPLYCWVAGGSGWSQAFALCPPGARG